MEENNIVDQDLYKTASKRVGFKIHITISLIVMAMLWIIWVFIFKKEGEKQDDTFFQAIFFLNSIWILIILAHYLIVYRWNKSLVEKEIKKIERENVKLQKKLIALKEKKIKDKTTNPPQA